MDSPRLEGELTSAGGGVVGVSRINGRNVRSWMSQVDRFYNSRRRIQQRRTLRSALTPAEATLWRALQRSALHGRKFRRQHGIGPYIVDFYCAGEKLIVELDGAAHEGDLAARSDQLRESFLRERGLAVLRIENRHAIENLEEVLEYIRQHFRDR